MIETFKVEDIQKLVEDIENGVELDIWCDAEQGSEVFEKIERLQHSISKAQVILTLLTFGTVNIDGTVQATEFARNIHMICSTALSNAKDQSLQAERSGNEDTVLKCSGAIEAYETLFKAISIKFH